MRRIGALLLILTCLFLAGLADLAAESAEDYRVSLVTTGPGSELYLWWGHSALMVENLKSGEARFYDFGVFSFDTENFFLNFLLGRLWYMAYSTPASYSLQRMIDNDRTLLVEELRFPPGAKLELIAELERQVRPENRDYLYDYYLDNCATRIRDLLNEAYGNRLYLESSTVPAMTVRQQTRRFTGRSSLFEWVLMFLMSGRIDDPITGWEAMFLPSEIPRYLHRVTLDSPAAEPAVVGGEYLHRGEEEHPVPDVPGPAWPGPAVAGIVIALLLIAGRRSRGIPFRLGQLLYRLLLFLCALLGSVLFFFAFFTDHAVTWGNWNLLLLNPLHWLALASPYRVPEEPHRFRLLLLFLPWVLTIDLSLLLLIGRGFGYPPQAVGQIIAFLLPAALGVAGPWIVQVLKRARA